MKSWSDFSNEEPDLAKNGRKLLFPDRQYVGYAFLATLRKDGAPRLHPISVVICNDHLYVIILKKSPKCTDLLRDGRYALQAFPPATNEYEEFYLAGRADRIRDNEIRHMVIEKTNVTVEENEELFELLLDRVMHTKLVDQGAPSESPIHRKWRESS